MSTWGEMSDLQRTLADREKSYTKFEYTLKQADRDHCHLMAIVVDIQDDLDDYVHEIRLDVKQYIKEIFRNLR